MDTLIFIPEDKLIILNGERLVSDSFIPTSSFEGTIRAVHWSDTDKHVEFTNSYRQLTDADVNVYVTPYIMLFRAEQTRLAKEENDKLDDATYCAEQVRAVRDNLLARTDYLLMPDYPLSVTDKTTIEVYRQALRDITKDPSFPWTGTPVENIPWPKNPLAK